MLLALLIYNIGSLFGAMPTTVNGPSVSSKFSDNGPISAVQDDCGNSELDSNSPFAKSASVSASGSDRNDAKGIDKDVSNVNRSSEKEKSTKLIDRKRMVRCLITIPIIFLYSKATIERNPAWKDDKTLFLEAYKVCPTSAKLNLQISKLHFNEGNITGSRYYVNKAYEIDPEFCDIGYEEVRLLDVFR